MPEVTSVMVGVVKLSELLIPEGARVLFAVCSDDRFSVKLMMGIDCAAGSKGWDKHVVATPGTILGLAEGSPFNNRELLERAVRIFQPTHFVGITHIGRGSVVGCHAAADGGLGDLENIQTAHDGLQWFQQRFGIPAYGLVLEPLGTDDFKYRLRSLVF